MREDSLNIPMKVTVRNLNVSGLPLFVLSEGLERGRGYYQLGVKVIEK